MSHPETPLAPPVPGHLAERPSLYPSRVLERAASIADALQELLEGKREIVRLSEEERTHILKEEERLGIELEQAFRIAPFNATFASEYFLTPVGRKDFEKTLDIPFPEEAGGNTPAIKRYLFSQRKTLASLPAKTVEEIARRSLKHSEDQLFESAKQTLQPNGSIALDRLPFPEKMTLLLTPEKTLLKIQALLALKRSIKDSFSKEIPGASPQYIYVRNGLIRLYQKRINTLLVDLKITGFHLAKSVASQEEISLSGEEKILLHLATGTQAHEQNLARYDKLIRGADTDTDGRRLQIGMNLRKLADRLAAGNQEGLLSHETKLQENDLDTCKIRESLIPATDTRALAEETLRAYDLLSQESPDTYSPDRPFPAQDDKWRVLLEPHRRTFSVNGKSKMIFGPLANLTLTRTLGTLVGHEIEGHVLQHANRASIPLRIFREVGAGRSDVLAECGAMTNESRVNQEILGTATSGHPHYLRAMQKKLEGGHYFDCVQAFYVSALEGEKTLLSLKRISPEQFQKKAGDHLRIALNRTARLFQGGAEMASNQPFLTKSKDTAYAEQIQVFYEFQKRGLEKFIFVGGVDIDSLPFLVETGFLDPKSILEPKLYALKIWERLKPDYLTQTRESAS